MQIDDRKHKNGLALNAVEDAMTEPAWNCAPYLAVDDLILHRVQAEAGEKSVDLLHERTAKARALAFVPLCCPPDVRLCRTPDSQPVSHKSRRMSSRTVSHASTSPG